MHKVLPKWHKPDNPQAQCRLDCPAPHRQAKSQGFKAIRGEYRLGIPRHWLVRHHELGACGVNYHAVPHDKNIYEFKHVKRGRRTGSDLVIYLKQGSDHKDIFWYIAEKPAKVVKTQKGDGKYNPNTNPIYEKLGLEQMSPISKTKLFEHIKNKLASLGEPCADSDVQRIFNNTKKTYMVFDEVSKLWRGRLYIPETAFNKPTEGGAL